MLEKEIEKLATILIDEKGLTRFGMLTIIFLQLAILTAIIKMPINKLKTLLKK